MYGFKVNAAKMTLEEKFSRNTLTKCSEGHHSCKFFVFFAAQMFRIKGRVSPMLFMGVALRNFLKVSYSFLSNCLYVHGI